MTNKTQSVPANALDEIRARHEADKKTIVFEDGWLRVFNEARVDRAALLRALDEALAALLAIRDTARTALGCLDDPTGGDHVNDMRRASDVLRAAIEETGQ